MLISVKGLLTEPHTVGHHSFLCCLGLSVSSSLNLSLYDWLNSVALQKSPQSLWGSDTKPYIYQWDFRLLKYFQQWPHCYYAVCKNTPTNNYCTWTQKHNVCVHWLTNKMKTGTDLTVLVGTLILRNSASRHSTGQGAWRRVKLGPWVFNWKTNKTSC